MAVLANKKVLLGICGGIAAYKTPGLIRELRTLGALVRVVMTRRATHFIGPTTLQAISGHPVRIEMFDPLHEGEISHIELARWADVVLIAPATANLVGHLANGLADDLLTTLLLATTAPVLIAPSMNTKMLQHPMVRRNLQHLEQTDRLWVIAPDEGELACLETGPGRLPDVEVLIEAILCALSPKPLAHREVLVTLGPTREWIDDVRFLSNPSSGRMGFAMSRTARRLGADVVAVAGPTTVRAPDHIRIIRTESAREMHQAVFDLVDRVDIAVFTAAVADIRPAGTHSGKIPKTDLPLEMVLQRNPDILAEVCRRDTRPFCIGFAAETVDLERRTTEKCARKGCDLMVGNPVGPGGVFGQERTQVVVTDAHRVLGRFGPDSKDTIASEIWSLAMGEYEQWLRARPIADPEVTSHD